jgi:hypothetical protein
MVYSKAHQRSPRVSPTFLAPIIAIFMIRDILCSICLFCQVVYLFVSVQGGVGEQCFETEGSDRQNGH